MRGKNGRDIDGKRTRLVQKKDDRNGVEKRRVTELVEEFDRRLHPGKWMRKIERMIFFRVRICFIFILLIVLGKRSNITNCSDGYL